MRISRSHLARILVAAGLLALSSSPAFARTENVRWQHPAPNSVAGFKVHVGPSSGNYSQTIDVGLPVSGSVFAHALNVSNNAAVYIAITAYDSTGRESAFSNEGFRPVPLGQPGQPTLVGN